MLTRWGAWFDLLLIFAVYASGILTGVMLCTGHR